MTTRLTHLAINADDLDASRRFYAGVLGLDFAEYLGPEFLRTELNGLLVAPGDPSQLADACLQLLKDNELISQIVMAGNKTVRQRFNIDSQIEQLSGMYEELTSHAK